MFVVADEGELIPACDAQAKTRDARLLSGGRVAMMGGRENLLFNFSSGKLKLPLSNGVKHDATSLRA
jgi:hypothetical protein